MSWHTELMKSVSVFASDLHSLLSARVSPSLVERTARAFQVTNKWDPLDPVNKEGACLLVAWLDHVFSGYGDIGSPGPETLSFLLAGRQMKDILVSRPQPYSRSLKDQLFAALQSSSPGPKADFIWSKEVLGALSDEDLRGFKWRNGGSSDGNDIMRVALSRDRLDVVEMLLERGWEWSDSSLGQFVSSPAAWDLFVGTGGDPFAPTYDEDFSGNPIVRPLWKQLLETSCFPSSTEAGVHIEAWAVKNAASEMKQKELQDYWKKLDHAGTLQSVLQSIRARKDWPDLVNENGENVLMVGTRKHIGVFEKLESIGKAKPLFSHVDDSGWSMWHHLLRLGSSASEGMWKTVLKSAPCRPDADSGLLVSMLNKPRGFEQKSLPSEKALKGVLSPTRPGTPRAEDWWAGTPDGLEKLARYLQGDTLDERGMDKIYWGSIAQSNFANQGPYFSCSDFSKRLSALIHEVPPPDTLPPEVLGGLALNELMTARKRGGDPTHLDVCDRLISAGASISLSAKARETVDKALEGLPSECASRFNQLCLAASISPAAPAPRPRTRI